ncbi:hypothetical protein A2U01_0094334, partial [Trifolium medium]|nr:hypothetical protein [Trifolium medium]
MVLKSWLGLEEIEKVKGIQYFCKAARGAIAGSIPPFACRFL